MDRPQTLDITAHRVAFLRHMQAKGYADMTIRCYRANLRPFRSFLQECGITDLRQVRPQEMREYQARIMATPNAVETKAMKIRAVKRFFDYLIDTHQLLVNPTEGLVETSRKGRKLGPVLTVNEVRRLLAQPNLSLRTGIRDRALMEVLYATGIRSNELLRLDVQHVDLADQVLIVRHAKGRRQRVVPLSQAACQALKTYLKQVRPWHARKSPGRRRLFLLHDGRPMTAPGMREILGKYRQQAGIRTPVSPHTFRRTCATHLLQHGADIRYIQQLLGHRHLRTTQFYTKISPSEVKTMHGHTHPGQQLSSPATVPETTGPGKPARSKKRATSPRQGGTP